MLRENKTKGGKTMTDEKKVKPEPNALYKVNIWYWKFTDLIWNPRRHLKKIPLKEGMTVVDYGCGPGRYTIPVAELIGPEGRVFAIDIQPLAIKTVKEKAARGGLTNVETILVDSYDTGIHDSSIDLVLLVDTFHQIGDGDALLHEIHRILKPDGFLFMDPGHMKMPKAKEIVENAGLFTIIKSQGKDMLVAPKTK
jgi:ubiquinone/menaquinone biosynthesis C-methylase UbiE